MEMMRQELAHILKSATADQKAGLQAQDANLEQQIESYRNKLKSSEKMVGRRVQILVRYRQRTEESGPSGKQISITNTESGASITLERAELR